jgi:hypothetical protein
MKHVLALAQVVNFFFEKEVKGGNASVRNENVTTVTVFLKNIDYYYC